ncbi:MAG: hypothetical protein AB7K71_26870 [Polyangiaceae bacterium]
MQRILALVGAASLPCLMIACGNVTGGSSQDPTDNATGGYYVDASGGYDDDATGGLAGVGGTPLPGTGGVAGIENTGGVAGAPGTAGSAGMAGSAGAETYYYNPEEYAAFAQCASPLDCDATLTTNDDVSSVIAEGADCLLSALRDRTPGAYKLGRDTNYGDGSSSDEDLFLIADDGAVVHSSLHYPYSSSSDPMQTTPVQRCELQPPSFFQSCLDAITSDPGGALAHDCAQTLGPFKPLPLTWFTSCEAVEYTCSAE